MSRDQDAPGLAADLDRLRDRLADDSLPEGWSAELQSALGPWREEDGPPDSLLDTAARRLLLMAEVWACLAAEGGSAADGQARFFAEALDRLARALRSGEPGPAADWIVRESEASWGEYLALLDPDHTPGPAADPWEETPTDSGEEDAVPAIELAALLRTIAGPGAAGAPAKGPIDPPQPRAVPAPIEEDRPRESATAPAIVDPPGEDPEPDLIREARSLGLDPEVRDAFLADLTDLFGRIQGLVLGLGGGGGDAGRLLELGRCYHTLKGAAGSVGLARLAVEIHDLEDRLEQAGTPAPAELVRVLERSVGQIEGVIRVLEGPRPEAGQGDGPAGDGEDAGPPQEARPEGFDGLVRVPADRFEELTDLCSELLTRRKAWADQAERMRGLADSARACGLRLRSSVDRLGEVARGEELAGLVRRMTEQAEDLAALAASAREASVPASEEAEALSRLAVRLWDTLQSVRLVPVGGLFRRLVRVAREAARVEGREVRVELVGEEIAADRVLLDRAYEPLVHVVRNAVGHGIEAPDARARAGKPAEGRVTLTARREGSTLEIAVEDDGRGLDDEAIAAKGRRLGLIRPDEAPSPERVRALIFQPGFSTRGQANAISGRGVGMDVVAREVEGLRGRVDLTSEAGRGTRLTIRLPARLSLEHVMVVRVGGQAFAVPTAAIEAIHRGEEVGGRQLPVADLGSILGIVCRAESPCPTFLIVRSEAGPTALRVDRVDGALELVVRPLGPLLAGHPAVSGVGLTTGGEIVPSLDVAGLLRLSRDGAPGPIPTGARERPRALVVDDSLSVRRLASRNLRALGLEVEEAADGEQALGKLRSRAYRLILSDLEMPKMDGFALLAELGRTGALGRTPVVVNSTRTDGETRRRVLALGARAYLTKPVGAEELAGVVGAILAEDSEPARC